MNIKYAAVHIIALALGGCNPVDVIEGRSPFRENQERLAKLVIPDPSIVAPINLADAIAPAPVQVVVQQPECTGDVFRISKCEGGKIKPWSDG